MSSFRKQQQQSAERVRFAAPSVLTDYHLCHKKKLFLNVKRLHKLKSQKKVSFGNIVITTMITGLSLITWTYVQRSTAGCCLGDSSKPCFWVADRKTSGRCQCGPAKPTGKCFCLPLSSSSGSWSLEEHYSSVLINFWPLLLPPPILFLLCLYVSFSLFCSLTCFLEAFWWLCMEDVGFTRTESDECPYTKGAACDHCQTCPRRRFSSAFRCFLSISEYCSWRQWVRSVCMGVLGICLNSSFMSFID